MQAQRATAEKIALEKKQNELEHPAPNSGGIGMIAATIEREEQLELVRTQLARVTARFAALELAKYTLFTLTRVSFIFFYAPNFDLYDSS